jgi:hypothetical protein
MPLTAKRIILIRQIRFHIRTEFRLQIKGEKTRGEKYHADVSLISSSDLQVD